MLGWVQLTFSLFFNPSVNFLSGLFQCCLKANLVWLCFVVGLTELYVYLKNKTHTRKKKQVLYCTGFFSPKVNFFALGLLDRF